MGKRIESGRRKRPSRHTVSPAALDVLLAHRSALITHLRRWTGHAEGLEDLLHDAYLKVLSSKAAPRDEERIVVWFGRMLRNAGVDRFRRSSAEDRARRRWAAEMPRVTPAEAELTELVCTCVNEAIALVRPAYREILRRVDVEGRPVGSVARRLELTPANARVRLHRARAALRSQLLRICGVCAKHGCLPCTCRRPAPR